MASSEATDGTRDLVQRLTPSLRRFARALGAGRGRAGVADDLVRTALERLHSLPNETEAAVKAALYAGVVHANRIGHTAQALDGDVARRTPRGGVAQAIERLPLDQREVLLLVVLEHFTYDEVASILSIPRSSIVARLVRARGPLSASGDDKSARPPHLRVVK